MKSGRIVSELDSEKSKKVAFHALCSISWANDDMLANRNIKLRVKYFFMILILVSKI